MQHTDTTWPPRLGDAARVKETGYVGTIIRLKGTRTPRYYVETLPRATGGDVTVQGRGATPRTRRLWYGLDELEPPS
jgi:hypothetical protein